jgi:hypothetical protein
MRKVAMSPAMVAALAITALLAFVDVAAELTPSTWEWVARWEAIRVSGDWVACLLFAAGWADLARRANGPTRPLLWLLSLASWTPLASYVAHDLMWYGIDDPDRFHTVFSYVKLAERAIFVGTSVVMTLAAQSWRSARLLSLVAVGVPLIKVGVAIPTTLQCVLALGFLVAQAVLIERSARGTRDIGPSTTEAAMGFALAGKALWVRLLLALFLNAYAGFLSDYDPIKGPFASGMTLLIVGWGALRASHSGIVGLPRTRLVVGSALVAGWGAFQIYLASSPEMPFAVVAPLLGLTGVLLVILTAVAVASTRGDYTLSGLAWLFGILITLFLIAGLGEDRVPDVSKVANLIGMFCLPIICGQLASRLRQVPSVPSARVL